MRIAVLGGGPGGLYFAALARQLGAGQHGGQDEITVWERNAPDDTFGFGVVFSDETLGGIEHADPAVHAAMEREFARWDDIDVHYRGQVITSGGHGFAALSRRRLLRILQDRCAELGVTVRFQTEAPDAAGLAASYDLVVGADGANSAARTVAFGPTVEVRDCTYIWLGTDRVFDAFTFAILETPHGVMQVHAYPYSDSASTLILEMHNAVWHRAGLADKPVGDLAELLTDVLGGHSLLVNSPRWVNFATVRCERWRHGNIVLLGDAAHTAHFSIGSGTKLAMEDALALAA